MLLSRLRPSRRPLDPASTVARRYGTSLLCNAPCCWLRPGRGVSIAARAGFRHGKCPTALRAAGGAQRFETRQGGAYSHVRSEPGCHCGRGCGRGTEQVPDAARERDEARTGRRDVPGSSLSGGDAGRGHVGRSLCRDDDGCFRHEAVAPVSYRGRDRRVRGARVRVMRWSGRARCASLHRTAGRRVRSSRCWRAFGRVV